MSPDERRGADLVSALGAVRARIADACAAAGRDPRSVTLVAVTKTRPVTDLAALIRLGVFDIGESRDQEAKAKVAEIAELLADSPARESLTWHFVGTLQPRKCRSVASYAGAVHSLDRTEIVDRLGAGVERAGRPPLDVFVQVSLDGDPQRGGVPVDGLEELADAVTANEHLRLRGVMAVPPLGSDADTEFARLAELAERLREQYPQADAISAGMSDDLEPAVRNGSTHVRVGTALLGRREQVLG